MTRDLSRLFRPKSIAVVGGGAWGPAVVEQCLKMRFQGPIWPVHPTRAEMHDQPCCAALADLPGVPDAVFVGVNRHLTLDTVAALSAMGAGGAVCFASGFAEAEDDRAAGAALQARLVAAAGAMPVLGPNCYGLINYLDGALLWPDQHGGKRVDRGVAIVGQSSNMLINMTMQRRGLPIAYVIAAGNQAQTGLSEMGMAVLDDPRVTALGLHMEGPGPLRDLEALAAKARALKKPIIVLKIGRSAKAQSAALSHTASMAGGDRAGRAVMRRLGMGLIDTLPSFLQALVLAHVHGALPGYRLSSMSCSGGEASLIADAAYGRLVHFPDLAPDQAARIKETLSDLVAVANPLDYHTFIWDDVPRMTETYAAMMGLGFDLNLLVYDLPRADRCDPQAWDCGLTAVRAAQSRTGARVAMVATLPETMPEAVADAMIADGVAPMAGLEDTLVAAEALATTGAAWAAPAPAPVAWAPSQAYEDAVVLDEARAKAWLASHGVTVPEGGVCSTPAEAAEVAQRIGFPVAVKGLGIAHKTEAGAVALNLASGDAVCRAASGMADRVSGFLVERMATGGVAELIVGVLRDPVWGVTLRLGAGGILTELMPDHALLPVPADADAIDSGLAGLAVNTILTGYRGKPAANRDAIIATILAIQAAVLAEGNAVLELDVNPLIVSPDTAIAVDVLVSFAKS